VKLLVSWLRDFVDVTIPVEELGQLLSMRGFELAGIEAADAAGGSTVVDLEITANRPDCLSVIGLAREVATALNLPLRQLSRGAPAPPREPSGRASAASGAPLALASLEVGNNERVSVTLEDADLCPRYAAAVAEVTVGPSPSWLAARLHAAGVRPINNIVDVTNYVLMELGQPMHAFDLARLAGPAIRIRRARHGERSTTLDGVDRALTPDMLVIADANRPQAIAGVMGGAESEVTSSTRFVVFESANFDPKSVRITSRKIGLKTEAAVRFGRGADIGAPVLGIERACALLEAIGAGHAVGPVVDCYPSPRTPRHVPLRRSRIARLLGQSIPDDLVEGYLSGLGFTLARNAAGWDVSVPSFRVDIAREADLIEEVARHYGYDRLPTTFPELREPPASSDPRVDRDRQARQIMTAAGFTEAVTFSFIEAEAAARFTDGAPPVPISHPLSEKFAALRPSLLPGLLESLAYNRRREQRDVQLFEIGRRFSPEAGERRTIALVWTGTSAPPHWSGSQRPVDFFDVKGVVENFCARMGVDTSVARTKRPYLIDGRTAAVQVDGTELGTFGQLSPKTAATTDLSPQDDVYVAEIDLDALDAVVRGMERGEERGGRGPTRQRVTPLPRYPSVVRDVSILVDDALPAATIRGTIRSAAPLTLVDVREFDRYQGKGIPEGRVSVSLRLTFRSPERTLTDAEVQQAMDRVVAALVREHNAVQR
jgi:phenylalanyl-tRNA synthetase beta chain